MIAIVAIARVLFISTPLFSSQRGRLVFENLATGSCMSHAIVRARRNVKHIRDQLMGQADSANFSEEDVEGREAELRERMSKAEVKPDADI
jgi:hypothetical protein